MGHTFPGPSPEPPATGLQASPWSAYSGLAWAPEQTVIAFPGFSPETCSRRPSIRLHRKEDLTSMKSEIAPFTIICAMCAGMGFAANHPHHECPWRYFCEEPRVVHQPEGHEREPVATSTKEIAQTVAPTGAASAVPFGWNPTLMPPPMRQRGPLPYLANSTTPLPLAHGSG
jgi:hypothetical protein